MSVDIQVGDLRITSVSLGATEDVARRLGDAMQGIWLKDYPEDRPLIISMSRTDGVIIVYSIRISKVN